MGTIHPASGPPDGPALDYQPGGPTVPRMLVGSRLRQLRTVKGITASQAGAAIRAPASGISRLELGLTAVKAREVADLLTYYDVADQAERATLLALAEQASVPDWWHTYRDVVPDWFGAYLGLEQAASIIRGYEAQFIPGLLQTQDYARAVLTLGHGDAPAAEAERRVGLRMKRQQLLRRPDAPRLWVIIEEAALRRPVGGTATTRAQLRHLTEVAELPRVTIEILPSHAGGHAAAAGPITILRFPEDEIPDMIYLEHPGGAVYADKPADIDRYRHIMNNLSVQAESPTATTAILHRIVRET
jgi:transcriptional regulator with XRE-family HTH domain